MIDGRTKQARKAKDSFIKGMMALQYATAGLPILGGCPLCHLCMPMDKKHEASHVKQYKEAGYDLQAMQRKAKKKFESYVNRA